MSRIFRAILLLFIALLLSPPGTASGFSVGCPENRAWGVSANPDAITLGIGAQAPGTQWGVASCGHECATDGGDYVNQNPWSEFDPDGLSAWTTAFKIIRKGGDIAGALQGASSHLEKAYAASEAGDHLAAFGHNWAAASELLPVSVSDVEGMVDSARMAVQAGQAAAVGDLSGVAQIAQDEITDKVKKKALGGKKGKHRGDYRGGSHRETSKPANDGRDSHHMPAKEVSGIDEDDGPAIQMDPHDHKRTSSNGSNPGSQEYREMIGEMIEGDDMRGAMATEIRDVRRAAHEGSGDRSKYNGATREMMGYSRKKGYVPKNPQQKVRRTR